MTYHGDLGVSNVTIVTLGVMWLKHVKTMSWLPPILLGMVSLYHL